MAKGKKTHLRWTRLFARYLDLMVHRTHEVAKGSCFLTLNKGYDLVKKAPAGTKTEVKSNTGEFRQDCEVSIGELKPIRKITFGEWNVRYVQFCFERNWFAMDLPEETFVIHRKISANGQARGKLVHEEQTRLLKAGKGFFRERRGTLISDPGDIAQHHPICKKYKYTKADIQMAAEDTAYLFFELWKLSLDREIIVRAASFEGDYIWEDGKGTGTGEGKEREGITWVVPPAPPKTDYDHLHLKGEDLKLAQQDCSYDSTTTFEDLEEELEKENGESDEYIEMTHEEYKKWRKDEEKKEKENPSGRQRQIKYYPPKKYPLPKTPRQCWTHTFTHFLRIMDRRTHKIAKGSCFLTLEGNKGYDLVEKSPSGSKPPWATWPAGSFRYDLVSIGKLKKEKRIAYGERNVRYVQFHFEKKWFAMDLPEETFVVYKEISLKDHQRGLTRGKLVHEEQTRLLKTGKGFFRERSTSRIRRPGDLKKHRPICKKYKYTQADFKAAAEDTAYLFFDLWKLSLDREIKAWAAAFEGDFSWEDGDPIV